MSQKIVDPQDWYGYGSAPETTERLPYGRFRNVYVYITEQCQLRCKHCYMGDRLERATVMPAEDVYDTLRTWRQLGGSKLTLLGGEPTLHPNFKQFVEYANGLGYEKVIVTTNGLKPAFRKLSDMNSSDFAYIQISLDGGSAESHNSIRGRNTFEISWQTIQDLCARGFDTRIICTVNKANIEDCLDLLPMADEAGVTLVKYHVFSGIGIGASNDDLLVTPPEWIEFCDKLADEQKKHKAKISYQPTYARLSDIPKYANQGYRGCIGRTLDRISIFPDGRAYVCSYLFDTDLQFMNIVNRHPQVNRNWNELDLFTDVLHNEGCGTCKAQSVCNGGCPAEEVVMGGSSCDAYPDIVPVCRLWKSDA